MDLQHAPLVGAMALFLATGLAVFAGARFVQEIRPVERLRAVADRRFLHDLRQRAPLTELTTTVALIGIAAYVLGFVVLGHALVAAPLLLLGLPAPFILFAQRRRQRREAFELHLPAALQQLASYVSSGASLEQAFETASRSAPWPLNEEFDLIAQRVGAQGLQASLQSASERLCSRNFDLAVAVTLVGAGPGGDVVAALRSLSKSFLELERLRKKVRSATAQTRRAMKIMTLVPVGIVALGLLFQNERIDTALSSPIGVSAVIVAFLLYSLSVIWILQLQRSTEGSI